MKCITPRQKEVLEFIRKFVGLHKFPPTMREISEHFSISVKGAYDHVKALEKKKHIRCNSNQSRTIEILSDPANEEERVVRVPLLGSVAAGKPLFADENFDHYLRIPEEYVRKGKYFALKVQGDSMTGAGIINGDTAIVRQQPTAQNGDIVVAMVDDAVTLKRFFREKNRIKLQPENPMYPPLYTQNLRVLGRLTHILRTYE
jgi:repressor LexA